MAIIQFIPPLSQPISSNLPLLKPKILDIEFGPYSHGPSNASATIIFPDKKSWVFTLYDLALKF